MTPERHQQIKRLFLAAVELAPGEVESFLERECRDDAELLAEVESLLANHRTETLLGRGTKISTEVSAVPSDTDTGTEAALARAEMHAKAASAERVVRSAGTMIAGRYRIVSPLGRGGMGVVYRADDVELGQTVALKFLGEKLRDRPDAVEYLRREVRTARQVTNPNVVRVFDIGQCDGEVFISMEYVAGEDLESLVRRVGPLPEAKVRQIARQMASGLAAAHDAGILHRDLKPANVMIDDAGKVRILDFGIASAVDDERMLARLAGTPGFFAPEVLFGEQPSRQSDMYAWGLVIYFAATGKLPKTGKVSREEAGEALFLSGEGPELAECVCACLQADPNLRPKSADDLVAALGGGDPLSEALRAGRLPSFELVAAAANWMPSSRVIDGLLAAGLAALLLILLLSDRTLFLSRCGLVKSPEVLRDTAEQVLDRFGNSVAGASQASAIGVALDTDCLQYVRDHPEIRGAWSKVASGEIPAVLFWYRRGDGRLPPPDLLGDGQDPRLPAAIPGAAAVSLDGRGKLLSLQIVDSAEDAGNSDQRPDWQQLFEMAGLNWAEFRETTPKRTPPLFADEVREWEGPFVAYPTQQVRVSAAARAGNLVFFDVVQPWEAESGAIARSRKQYSRYVALRTTVWLVAIAVAAVLAGWHVNKGHVDWRGAWRVSGFVAALAILDWLCGSRHSFVLTEELASAMAWLQVIVFCGTIAGVAYLAVEPSARRWWPWSIITLRRLLDGRLADRGIWADVLLGVVVGLGSVLLRQACTLTNQLLGVPVSGLNDFDVSQNLLDHFGLRYKIAVFAGALLMAVLESLLLLTLVVVTKRVAKSTLLSAVVLVTALAAAAILGRGIISPIDWAARTLLLSIAAFVLIRFGLLATIAALATYYAVNNSPITLDWSQWYAPTGLVVVLTVAAALAACWRFARPSGTT
ncbi:MAG TPA: serine/threonine-protein kinase [Pirellulaceae bacterium]